MTTPLPYDTAAPFFPGALPSWLGDYDARRLTAYQVYENMYWSSPQTFKLMQRGSEANPIYVPSGRVITNTMHRYAGRDWGIKVDEALGTPAEQAEIIPAFTNLFRRERMLAQYNSNKLYGLMRGDWCFYIYANPLKPQGRRLSIRGLHPGQYFPIEDPNDVQSITGVDIVEQVKLGDKAYVKRQRYLRGTNPDHPNYPSYEAPITYQKDYFEVQDWQDPAKQKPFQNPNDPSLPQTLLPATITSLPVYHIKNFEDPDSPFGSSEMRGLERIMAAVNQSITDEEISLALEGLGLYATTSGPPVNENGEEVPWYLGPGRVVEHGEGTTFQRVSGVNSVGPYQEHLAYLHDWIGRSSGASDVAQGVVDVTVAESGVALALRMGPIIGAAQDKDLEIEATLNQFLYDLRFWLQEYEGINFGDAQAISTFGNKLPVDVKAEFDRLMQMYASIPPVITGAYFRDRMRELGMPIPLDVNGAAIILEQQAFTEAADPTGGRLEEEADLAADETFVEA